MPTYSAKTDRSPLPIALLTFEGTKLLDFAGPLQVFSDARYPDGAPAYDVRLLSETGGSLKTDTICQIKTEAIADHQSASWDTVLVSGGDSAYRAMTSKALCDYIKSSFTRCRRLGSICLGAFILAETGLLSGRSATTHWDGCAKLAADYPDVNIEDDAIYIEDRGVWTSAGVSTGVDMALEMVRRDLGTAEALRIAKSLVLPMLRSGGQRQFSTALAAQTSCRSDRFADLIEFATSNLRNRLSVAELAQQARMSERNFSRRFSADVGMPPAKFVEKLRVDHAAQLLQHDRIPLSKIQAEAGFANEEHMRRAFQRQLGVSPSSYAAKFAAFEL